MNWLIQNADILTMDQDGSFIKNGCVAIRDDIIEYVGDARGLPDAFKANQVIDARGKLAAPGFINTHTHTAMTLFRGYANDIPLKEWLFEKMWPLEDRMEASDAYWLSLLSIAEMISAGVTTFSDMYMFIDQTARAVEKSGIRAVLSRGLQGPDDKSQMRLKENQNLWEKWHGQASGRIRVMFGPHAIYTCSPDYLKECVRIAERLGAGIHIHLSETRLEVDECRKTYGKTPVEHLLDIGIFELPVLAAHCVHMTKKDMEILYEKNVQVAHCPSSNLKLGSGTAPVHDMLEMGINVSLGTDSAASSNNLSIMKEMSLAALIGKGVWEDPTRIPAQQALRMGTVYGARALGWENEIGSLEPGKKADVILIDFKHPHYHPWRSPEAHLIYSGYAGDVDTVIVNGEMLMENRRLITLDLEEIYGEVERIQRRIMGRE